ncbi:MAG: hypothetical protein Q9181_006323 [Wetmoreana brouardii]
MLEVKAFQLHWADPSALKEQLEESHGTMPEPTMNAPDLRVMPAAEWRNKLRDLYEFDRLGRQLLSLVFEYTQDEDDESLNILSCDWGLAQTILKTLRTDQMERIGFKTRVLDQNEVLKEFIGVPTALQSYISVDDSGCLYQTAQPQTAS